MKLTFKIDDCEGEQYSKAVIRYVLKDSCFITRENAGAKTQGVSVPLLFYATTELMVSQETGSIVGYEGHEPYPDKYWEQDIITLPTVIEGKSIKVDGVSEMMPGTGVDLGGRHKQAYYDKNTKIFMLGDNSSKIFRVLSNMYLGIKDDKLESIYITNIEY